jgi:thiol-disulfide isomerase/thioredoxin
VAPGLIACAAALVLAVAIGLIWRRGNGRIRDPRPARALGPGPAAGRPAAAQAQAFATGRSTAALSEPGGPGGPGGHGVVGRQPAQLVTVAELGQSLGSRATLLQFSSAFCVPCRATRRILAEVAGMTDGVVHVEIDAESHLDLVRRLDVRRTPTVLVLGPDGQVRKRASGQPRKADVIAVLGSIP